MSKLTNLITSLKNKQQISYEDYLNDQIAQMFNYIQ